MEEFEIVVPVLLGLEAFTAREVRRLGYETASVEDGRITFKGGYDAICRANMNLRTGERVLIKVGEFTAMSFEELFEKTYALDWERYIVKNGAFPVKGHCLKSQLASERDCQAIIKKATAKKMSEKYGIEWLPEDGGTYQIQFSIMKNRVTIMIDTSGVPLHKRGYRQKSNLAPLRETLAAAMVMMSYWKFEYPLCDPFCGSGTIPIEAALFKRNIAPGLNRRFAAMNFDCVDEKLWERVAEEARDNEHDVPLEIYAYDIDEKTARLAEENAKKAGVGEYITIGTADAADFFSERSDGTIICNPPYGERLSDKKECEELYRRIGKSFQKLDNWAYYIMTSNEQFENCFGKKADKKRKLYNGMIRCNVYQYFSKKR